MICFHAHKSQLLDPTCELGEFTLF